MVINTNVLAGAEIRVICSFDCTNVATGDVQMPDGQWLPICESCLDKVRVDNTESN